jgi:RNA polymerase sigma factor (sigma-70 family)
MTASNTPTDHELVMSYMKGNENALTPLLHKHKDKIFTGILILVKDHALADDIFQDTFIKVIDNLRQKKYNEEGKFLPWVNRIAHNLCIDHFRKLKKENKFEVDDEDFDIINYIPDEATLTNIAEPLVDEFDILNILDLAKLIQLLPDEQREVLFLKHFKNYKFKDIAEMMHTSLPTTLGRMRYGLQNLKKLIENELK